MYWCIDIDIDIILLANNGSPTKWDDDALTNNPMQAPKVVISVILLMIKSIIMESML